jgi:hypothetical protein
LTRYTCFQLNCERVAHLVFSQASSRHCRHLLLDSDLSPFLQRWSSPEQAAMDVMKQLEEGLRFERKERRKRDVRPLLLSLFPPNLTLTRPPHSLPTPSVTPSPAPTLRRTSSPATKSPASPLKVQDCWMGSTFTSSLLSSAVFSRLPLPPSPPPQPQPLPSPPRHRPARRSGSANPLFRHRSRPPLSPRRISRSSSLKVSVRSTGSTSR